MKNKKFDYTGAKEAGYSDDEIMSFLSEKHPKFDVEGAINSGYSPQEVNEFLSTYKPKKSLLEKTGRLTGQFALGAAENALLPYELGVAPLASKDAMNMVYREDLGQELEDLMNKKAAGQWTPEDQTFYDHISEQIKNPSKSEEFVQTADLGIRGLAEKATGLDLKPEGFLEHAVNWIGFIKNPKNAVDLAKTGIKSSNLIKSILPTGTELLRGIGAGGALELAEQGNFGPIGTIASTIVGDLLGGGIAGVVKGTAKAAANPKQALAEGIAKFTPKEKLDLQKEIIKDFRDSGLQADIGTITDSNMMKMIQSRLSQSGLTGKNFDNLKKELTSQFEREYKSIANSLGEAKYAISHEAGEIAKQGIKDIREADLRETRKFYEDATKNLSNSATVESRNIAEAIRKLENNLNPGSLKSNEQKAVLDVINTLKKDIYDSISSSKLQMKRANVKELMNDKIALNDIINYEVQGGTKQLLKNVVGELDRAIISHGKENPSFAKNYINANKRFSSHAKTFRNKNVEKILKSTDPADIMNKMNSIQGIRDLENILSKSYEGKRIFSGLKRLKLDQVVGNNLVDSTTQQIKLGTFSKLLEKGKNKDIIREILGAKSFKKLEMLQKNSGRLAEAVQKFYNASQSGSTAIDAAILAQGMSGIVNLLYGNPWPLMKIAGGITGARKLSGLLADPEFLKLTEEVILASEIGGPKELIQSFERLRPYILPILQENND